jgi:protein-L-isoaspartate O-methyltransferase
MEPVQAYQDRAVVILSDGEGLPVSASTQPAMMAIMLRQLGLGPGHRVLEVGTGTGYNAGLWASSIAEVADLNLWLTLTEPGLTMDAGLRAISATLAMRAASPRADVTP